MLFVASPALTVRRKGERTTMEKEFKAEKLCVQKYASRPEMARAASEDIAARMKAFLATHDEINMIFAAAPSQSDTLALLREMPGIDWSRVNAFHMDEYIGLAPDAPQGFGNFLKKDLFDRVPFKSVNLINGGAADLEAECERYTRLLNVPIHIVVLGIGENGHIAFNDPGEADFHDKKRIKVVNLDEKCRMQQVHDGCFASLDLVPKQALSLTVPALVRGEYLFCLVPAQTKAEAVKHTVSLPVTEQCPATIMKRHDHAVLYCDNESGSLI